MIQTAPNENTHYNHFFARKSLDVPEVRYAEIYTLVKYSIELKNFLRTTKCDASKREKVEDEITRVERYILTFRKRKLTTILNKKAA